VNSNDAPVLVIKSTPGIMPEQSRDARARAWKFIFDTHRKKAVEQDNGQDEAKKFEHRGRRSA